MAVRRDIALALATVIGVPAITAALGAPVTLDGAVPLAGWLGLAVLARRRWPVGVLLASAAAIVALQTSGLYEGGWLWPASVAYASATLSGRLGWAAGTGLASLGLGWSWEWSVHNGSTADVVARAGTEALWLGIVLAAATAYRNWRSWQDETVARLAQSVRERELDAARRLAEQRVQIAREVHDVVAHTLTVVGVQLRVAAEALDDAPEQSRAAIEMAQTVRGQALADLRGLVTVLRSEPVRAPVAGLADLPAVVSAVASGRLTSELVETGEVRPLPAPAGLAVTRVVQESLTNVVRHAGGTAVRVELHYGRNSVSVTVTDDGRGSEPAGPGHGLTGLQERVTALGGTFAAGPGPEGGFVVRAEIPVPAS